jgi:uncharacterized membrane protein
MHKSHIASMIISAVAAAGLAPAIANAGPAPAPSYSYEKCFGINSSGQNDCGSPGNHSCAGEAKRSNDGKSFVYVPSGTCAKIQGGATTPKG